VGKGGIQWEIVGFGDIRGDFKGVEAVIIRPTLYGTKSEFTQKLYEDGTK